MATRKAAKTKSATKKSYKSPKAPKAAITIKLNSKQRAQLKSLTKGTVDATTIQLTSEAGIARFLDSLVNLTAERTITAPKFAPPPKNTWWV